MQPPRCLYYQLNRPMGKLDKQFWKPDLGDNTPPPPSLRSRRKALARAKKRRAHERAAEKKRAKIVASEKKKTHRFVQRRQIDEQFFAGERPFWAT